MTYVCRYFCFFGQDEVSCDGFGGFLANSSFLFLSAKKGHTYLLFFFSYFLTFLNFNSIFKCKRSNEEPRHFAKTKELQ